MAIQLSISPCRNSVELGNICSWRTRYVGGRGRCLPLRSALSSPPFNPLFFFYSFLLYFLSFSIFFPLFSSFELITSSSLFFFFLNHNIYYRTQFYSFQRKILGHDSNSKLDPFSKLFRALPLIDHDAPMDSQIRVSGGIQ